MAKRIVVTGGRDFSDALLVEKSLDAILRKHGISAIIQGGADGADRLCAEWGWERQIPVATFNADWKAHGKAAGPKRNQRMIDEGRPDAAVAFPGGRGTADMVGRLASAGIPTWDLREVHSPLAAVTA
jgi:predicted Rossmann-fold nucleotide-binding protein